jgi:hypothetical protein
MYPIRAGIEKRVVTKEAVVACGEFSATPIHYFLVVDFLLE